MTAFQRAILCAMTVTCTSFAAGASEQPPLQPPKFKPVAVSTDRIEALPYDAGKIKFIVSADDSGGAYSVVELTELPGYKTAWHQHLHCEEAFYVLEGVLTITINDQTSELPAGSYILIPRGTPHAQGNFGKGPVRLLTTFTPGGFDRFFRDRVELYKKLKPGGPGFQEKFDELRAKHKEWVDILGTWTPPKH